MSFSPSSTSPTESENNNARIAKSFAVPQWYVKGFAANIRIRAETVMTIMDGITPERILDIGCGDGSLSIPLIPRAKHVTYLDQSPAMLELVASRIGQQTGAEISYINSGFMEAKLPATDYDLIICAGVLAYVQDVDAFLAKIRSVMRPGGILILECTDAYHFVSRITQLYRATTGIFKPKRFMTYPHRATEVVALTEKHGLRLKKSFCYFYGLPILEKLIQGENAYKWIRRIFGDITNNRRAWLGKEYLFYFNSKK